MTGLVDTVSMNDLGSPSFSYVKCIMSLHNPPFPDPPSDFWKVLGSLKVPEG
jgi:hypothetical protein